MPITKNFTLNQSEIHDLLTHHLITPFRFQLLLAINRGINQISELADYYHYSASRMDYHILQLEKAKLIENNRNQHRPIQYNRRPLCLTQLAKTLIHL